MSAVDARNLDARRCIFHELRLYLIATDCTRASPSLSLTGKPPSLPKLLAASSRNLLSMSKTRYSSKEHTDHKTSKPLKRVA